MKNYRFHILWVLLLSFWACSTVKVLDTEAITGFDLSDYATYQFYDIDTQADTVSPAFLEQVQYLQAEIAEKLEAFGLKPGNSQSDLLVNLGIVVEEKVQTRETNFREAPRYIGQYRYSWRSEEIAVGRYKVGTVSVHLVDRKNNELVWQGVAEGVIPEDTQKLQETIDEGVEELFSRIPSDSLSQEFN